MQSFSYTGSDQDFLCRFWAENVSLNLNGSTFILHAFEEEIEINLPYLGAHNVSNALAATALAMAVGASLAGCESWA